VDAEQSVERLVLDRQQWDMPFTILELRFECSVFSDEVSPRLGIERDLGPSEVRSIVGRVRERTKRWEADELRRWAAGGDDRTLEGELRGVEERSAARGGGGGSRHLGVSGL
jgi:hypothetical protein